MSAAIYIDTALLAIPNYADTPEEAEEVILRLKHWSDIAFRYGARRISRRETAEDVLGELGFFPAHNNVKDLLEFTGLDEVYDANSVWSSYNTLLERSGLISETLGFEIDDSVDVIADPNILEDCCPPALRLTTESLFATILVADEVEERRGRFVASAFSGGVDQIQVSATANSARGASAHVAEPLPRPLAGPLSLIGRVEDMLSEADTLALWRDAETICDLHFAILLKALQIRAAEGQGNDIRAISVFGIGSDFLATITKNGCGNGGPYAGATLETCARIALGAPKNALRPFGKPDQTIRSRDKAKALRTHVTKGGVAIRLMVWERPDGTIEFANVGPKGELEISEGDLTQTFEVAKFG